MSVVVLRILAIAVCTSGRRMLWFQESADKLAISMREEREEFTLPRHYCGCVDVCVKVGRVGVGCVRVVENLEMEIIEWFVSKMGPVSWNRLLMLGAKHKGGDGWRGTPRQSLSIKPSLGELT